MIGDQQALLAAAPAARGGGLSEADRFWWRTRPRAHSLRRLGQLWTLWMAGIIAVFTLPAALLLYLAPLTFPVALACLAHAWFICDLYPRRAAKSVVAIGSRQSADPRGRARAPAERAALGLLADLLAHQPRELVMRSGLAMERGLLGVWLIGEQGAVLVRPGGRRVDCWCVRVSEADGLPSADREAHLLLALREDERGFATVANLGFSGAAWRLARHLGERERAALREARLAARNLA